MALLPSQINAYWQRYNQRRALTGLPSSYQEQRGALDPIMEAAANRDIEEAKIRAQHDIQNRQLSLQEQAQKDAARAANISGVANLGALGLGAYSLSRPSIADAMMAQRQIKTTEAANDLLKSGWPGNTTPASTRGGWQNMGGEPIPAPTSSAGPGGYAGVGVGSGGEGILSGAGSGTTIPTTMAAGDAGAGFGGAGGAASEGIAAESSGLGIGTFATPIAYAAGGKLASGFINQYSPIGGAREKSIMGNMAQGAGIGAAIGSVIPVVGTAIGAVVGSIIGGVTGLVEDASVICSELLRQGRISERTRTKCVVFRFRHIPTDMFIAYLEWAKPIVNLMRRGGVVNALLLPFAHAFVDYMVAMQDGKQPTLLQRVVWKYAWWRCEKIAQRSEQYVGEVA